MPVFSEISLLITNYNRTVSLSRLLEGVKKLDLQFREIVVSDDGSNPEHIKQLENLGKIYPLTILKAPKNKGLGNNINKGQDVIKTPYTLYIQEDFVPNPLFVEKLAVAHQFMQQNKELDFVRFYAYYKFPNLKQISDGFSEMSFSHLKFWQGYRKFYVYSDHPHLRRANFFDRFGRYDEGVKPDRTEYNMMMKVLAQNPKAYFYDNINELLDQVNTDIEPSTIKRNMFRNNDAAYAHVARAIYRYLRFNLELIIYKIKPKK
ncbi:glycosyltransferase family 2 protein [Pedobacter alpinus]|uniref:Glycosyltransferase family 2 protein n=1 Tax=Pedobacter alpinus TaxID=1590643 RepID=A0ABW5TW55_9SPHI